MFLHTIIARSQLGSSAVPKKQFCCLPFVSLVVELPAVEARVCSCLLPRTCPAGDGCGEARRGVDVSTTSDCHAGTRRPTGESHPYRIVVVVVVLGGKMQVENWK